MQKLKEGLNRYSVNFIDKLGCLLNPLILNFKNENNQLLVFFFHGLFESQKQKGLNHIDPQNNMMVGQFVEFIEYFLSHGYRFILPEDLIKGLKNDQPYAMITFDDGYYNNMLAVEILNKFRIPAVFFITTKNMLENKSFWWDIVFKYRAKQGSSIENIRNEQRSLKKHKYSYIEKYIESNFGNEAYTPWSDIDRPFTESEIRNLVENPYVSIGNHTHNHSILTNCNNDEIKEELRESNKILLDLTGKFPIATAFPNGDYNKQVLDAFEEEGFRYAFTTEQKKNLLPINNDKLVILDRYMTDTTKISKYGGYCRIGYTPDLFYARLKEKMNSVFVFRLRS
jgi:peptidoglycan/xylan/chitin deacetylase (PgdA/CDA1 family)